MGEQGGDRWAQWLRHRRFGGDPAAQAEMLRMLTGVRDGCSTTPGWCPARPCSTWAPATG